MKKRKAVTLLELVVTVVILGILVGIAVPVYTKAITRAKVKEAERGLIAIYAAQKNYKLKYGGYYGNLDVNLINSNLHLDLEETNWDYRAGNVGTLLGRADLKPVNNIILMINDTGTSMGGCGCTTVTPGVPCCYQGCTLY